MAEGDVNFDAIFNAARREEQVVTPVAVETAFKEQDDLFRTEVRKSLLWVTKLLIRFALGLFCITVSVRAWHMLIPQWGWIDADHLKIIDSILKSGVLVAAGGIAKDVVVKSLPTDKKAA